MNVQYAPATEVKFWVDGQMKVDLSEEPDITGIFADSFIFGEHVWGVSLDASDGERAACCTCFNEAVKVAVGLHGQLPEAERPITLVVVQRMLKSEYIKQASA
jgi:hypothetical protein